MENNNGKSWVLHIEIAAFFIAILTLFLNLSSKIDENSSQFTASMQKAYERMDKMNERSDKLYEMLVQLIRENNIKEKEQLTKNIEFDNRITTVAQNVVRLYDRTLKFRDGQLVPRDP